MGNVVAKKSPGPKYEPGFTQGQIFVIVSNNPEGIKEEQIRGHLREKFGICESKGVKRHLNLLADHGLVTKIPAPPRSGESNVWKPARISWVDFENLWSLFPPDVLEAVFSSTYIQECIQVRVVTPLIGNFYSVASPEMLDLAIYSHAPPEKLDSGIDFDLFFSRSVELSPSFVIDGFLRSSDRAWSMYSVACVLLSPTVGMEFDLVTSTFRSPPGRFIFQFLVYLIADSLKYPSRTDEIVTFLISENSMRILGLIFTDPVVIMIALFHAYELQRFNLWDAPSEMEGELLPERWVSLEEAWRKVKGFQPAWE